MTELARVKVPTLVVTGEAALDRVVPAAADARIRRDLAARARRDARAHRTSRPHHAPATNSRRWSSPRSCRARRREERLPDPIREIRRARRGRSRRCIDQPAGALRAAVVFAHPQPTHGGTMHTKVGLPGREGADAHRLRGAALQLPRRRAAAPARWTTGAARWTTFGPPSTSWPRSTPASRCGRPAFRSARGSRLTAGADDDRVCALIGIAPPVDRYDFAVGEDARRSRSSSSTASATS